MINTNYFKKLNYTKENIPTKTFNNINISGDLDSIENYNFETLVNQNMEIFNYTKNERQKNCGLGKLYIDEVKEKCNSKLALKIKKSSVASSISIQYKLDKENNVLYDQNYIEIESGANAKIFFFVDEDTQNGSSGAFRNALLSIKVGKNAHLEFVKVQNLNHNGKHFETAKLELDDNATVNVYDVQLGGEVNGVSTSTHVIGSNTEVKIFPLYFVNKQRRFDIEQNIIIDGKNTNGLIASNGVLKHKSKKICRGNIFFNNGCKNSFARFSDNTIMLNEGVVGMTIPIIFCDEDDVIGEHAASFEAIDADKLYYLMARGFDELSAKKLIAETNFSPVFEMIDDSNIGNALREQFYRHLDDE